MSSNVIVLSFEWYSIVNCKCKMKHAVNPDKMKRVIYNL